MEFIESDDHEGRTNYNAPVPADLQRLLLTGFSRKYVTGPWGWYLSQWIESEVFTFWVQYIHRNYKGKMYAQVNQTIYTLHHLVSGMGFGSLNDGQPVDLSFDRSHFFIIPGGYRQQVVLDKGLIISLHADFKREYLDRNKQNYAALQPLFKQYDADPSKACHEMSVIHNHLLEHPWKRVLEQLPHVANPVLYLEGQVRELLRIHYEQLEYAARLHEHQLALGSLTKEQFKAVHAAGQVISSDLTVTHNAKTLSRKVGINDCDLKKYFRQAYGMTINRYQIKLRLDFARELILSTNKSNHEIAAQCGFKNVSHFVQLFKKRYGQTPVAYRRGQHNAAHS